MNTETTDPANDSTPGNSSTVARSEDQPIGPPAQRKLSFNDISRWLDWRIVVVLVLAAVSIPLWRIFTGRAKAHPQVLVPMAQTVAVAQVTRQDLYNEVTIPAEFRPYLQVELHAKVSGYVEQINVDIGDRVKANQLLAKLEVPELKAELDRARAAQKRAEAEYSDAHKIYTRLQAVDKDYPNGVAQQELDAAEAKNSTTEAAMGAAKAEVERYETLISYTRITAPFDGVITHRYADPGSLIQAGTTSDTQSKPLVRLSDNYHLRLDFPVSVSYVKDVRVGDEVEVRVESLGGKTFTGTISRSAEKIDEETRTMITEVEVPNPKLELVPGMYATLVLKVEKHPHVLTIPTEAISADKRVSVYLVNSNREIEERPVTLGLETAAKFEIVSGLKEGDLVMIGSRSQVKPGQKVEAKLTGTLAQQ
jgi:RND family efflux transporter MFP subunit